MKLTKSNKFINIGYFLLGISAVSSALLYAKKGSFSPLPSDLDSLFLPLISLFPGGLLLTVGYLLLLKNANKYLRIVLSIVTGLFGIAVFYLMFILLRVLFIGIGWK